MSYQIKIDKRSLKSVRFISRLQRAIQRAFAESGKTQQEVAVKLEIDRSVVNRRLKDSANLTARSIADFAYALDKEIEIRFIDRPVRVGQNWILTAGAANEARLTGQIALLPPSVSNRTPRIEFVGADA